jgi:YggT family protein
MTILTGVFLFLTQAIINLYLGVLLLRLILQWSGAHFYNPLSQLVIKLTNPVVTPFRRVNQLWQGVDVATILVALIIEIIKLMLVSLLKTGAMLGGLSLICIAVADLLTILLDIYFYTILIVAILSWLHPRYNPVIETLYLIAEPLLRPARRLLPPIAGFDFSPLLVLILLKLTEIVIVQLLLQLGLSLG